YVASRGLSRRFLIEIGIISYFARMDFVVNWFHREQKFRNKDAIRDRIFIYLFIAYIVCECS
ncbi:MAG: hypothetical protein WCT04_07105, partial [Planctomycetota bacterium]